jgi:two-component system sensor histidine kinase GlrK
MVRPVRKLDTAIGAIGAGRLADPIRVNGPRDIRRLGERLEWLRGELLGIEQQKNRFMRHIAHELKTPLSAVRESTDLLLERVAGALTPTQRELADILRRNALELQRLVEDLLQLGEAQFRRLRLESDAVNLPQIVHQVVAGHELAARNRGVSFAVRIDDAAASFVADPDKVRVILDNLISNAIKHSPNGGTIEVRAGRDRGDVLIAVHDEGPGIPRGERDTVFDPFYQGRTTGSGVLKNSGVGLSIVREYAAAHGGDAQVGDDDRGGALLRVRLPVGPAREKTS